MSRWQPGAKQRLENAALELFQEQGFADTTVPQITARAGLTTRTFFRHFTDKREVLFAFEAELPAIVAQVLRDAPPALPPLDVIRIALEQVATDRIGGAHGYLRNHRSVVRSDEGLKERELRKHSVLADAARLGFLERGLDELTATIAAHVAVTVFNVSVDRWLDNDDSSLVEILRETVRAVTSLSGQDE